MFKIIIKIIEKFNLKIRLYKLVLSDKRTPGIVRIILLLMIGYAIFPFDFIPVLGLADDIAILLSVIWLIMQLIPKKIVDDSRKRLNKSY